MSASRDYEFLAIDRPLSEADRNALRALSTRATITLTRFVDTDPWGDFEADPAKLTQATGLLSDLKGLAAERGHSDEFDTRLSGLLRKAASSNAWPPVGYRVWSGLRSVVAVGGVVCELVSTLGFPACRVIGSV